METNLENQFLKLQDIILNQVDKFYFFQGIMQYIGPVQPTAIVSFNLDFDRINALVLAEAVPTTFLPPKVEHVPVL